MMKHFKLLALLLAIVMLASAFVACNKPEETTTDSKEETTNATTDQSGSESETEEPVVEKVIDIEKNNYKEDFLLSILPDCNPIDYYWVEEGEGDAMSEAVYLRQQKVLDHLGVNVVGSRAPGDHTTYAGEFKIAVKAMDGRVDTLLSHVNSGLPGLMSDMYLRDFNQMPGIDLDSEYWNRDFMDALSISGTKADYYYLGFSNFNILYTYVVAFNKSMMADYATSLDKSLYEMVNTGEWTLDQMLALAKLVTFDKTGDGKTVDDTFGLTAQQWVPWIGLLHASNINLVEMNDKGAYEVVVMGEKYKQKTSELVTKLKEFSASAYGWFEYPEGGTIKGCQVPLTTGRALMQLQSTYSLVGFLDYDIEFGVLPYPLYDSDQYEENTDSHGYRSLQWGGYLCIPAYTGDEKHTTMVGETLSTLAFFSDDVMTTFYEKLLGKKVADVPDDRKMLDLIWSSVCTDFGQTYSQESGTLYFLPNVTWPGDGGSELGSTAEKMTTTGNKKLAQFIKVVSKKSDAGVTMK